mmetsp:Transcript_62498/g.176690  ORF Transcript_62498/g.176690 Transcript_62498/m.176690 type:complete len:203 (+) Transcript_62498:833-1441(+)
MQRYQQRPRRSPPPRPRSLNKLTQELGRLPRAHQHQRRKSPQASTCSPQHPLASPGCRSFWQPVAELHRVPPAASVQTRRLRSRSDRRVSHSSEALRTLPPANCCKASLEPGEHPKPSARSACECRVEKVRCGQSRRVQRQQPAAQTSSGPRALGSLLEDRPREIPVQKHNPKRQPACPQRQKTTSAEHLPRHPRPPASPRE